MSKTRVRSRKSAPPKREKPETFQLWMWRPGVKRKHDSLLAYWGDTVPMNTDWVRATLTLSPPKRRSPT